MSRDISAIMRRVKGANTTPEIAFRKALWAAGGRFRVNVAKLPGKPDVVIAKAKLVIFIDGDFWHGNQWRRRNLPALENQFERSTSRSYWLSKIRRNMARDARVTAALIDDNWRVLRFWESEIKSNLEACVEATMAAVRGETQPSALSLAAARTVAEFFAGIGPMRLGLEAGGWRVVFANDLDASKRDMYRGHFGESDCLLSADDVHSLDADEIPDVTLAAASFPCNDLSLDGARRGPRGKDSSAFWGFTRALREMGERRPPIVLLENVRGFLTSKGGEDFEEALRELNALGYAVDAFILDASWFVPQSRERLFVIGVQDDDGPHESKPEIGESPQRPKPLADFINAHSAIDWKVRALPCPPLRTVGLAALLEDIPRESKLWRSVDRAAYLLSRMSERHRGAAERMIAAPEYSFGTIFRRVSSHGTMVELRVDDVARCLGTPRGGSGRQLLFKAGRGEYRVRLLTPRECARLAGAGDFTIDTTSDRTLFGFGGAVCVKAIEWIVQNYLDPVVNELLRGRLLGKRPAGQSVWNNGAQSQVRQNGGVTLPPK